MKRMIEEGLLDLRPRATASFGLHVSPTLPTAEVVSRADPLLVACERFEVLIEGKGGHAALPHLTREPKVAISSTVMALQALVERELNPLDSGLVSIAKVEAGDVFNVIPERVTIRGRVRVLSEETLLRLRDRAEAGLMSAADMYSCSALIRYSQEDYPPQCTTSISWSWRPPLPPPRPSTEV